MNLDHTSSNRHGDMLNSLLNAYVGCGGRCGRPDPTGTCEKQDNIRLGVDLMAARTKRISCGAEKLSNDGAEREIYKDNSVDDAIEGTRDDYE